MEEQRVNLLSRILMELFNIDMSSLPKEARKYPLLSEKFGIEPYQMVAFMETVEETFGIKIPESAIVTQKFDSFDDIIKIIISEKGE